MPSIAIALLWSSAGAVDFNKELRLSSPAVAARPAAQPDYHATAQTTPAQIMALPDSTVIIAPDGKRVSAADAKRAIDARSQMAAHVNEQLRRPASMVRMVNARLAQTLQAQNNQAMVERRGLAAELQAVQSANKRMMTPAAMQKSQVQKRVLTDESRQVLTEVGVLKPAIVKLNDRPAKKGFSIEPGQLLKIGGAGFGRDAGQVVLKRHLSNRPPMTLTVHDWAADAVYVELDATITGEEDFDDATLTLRPPGQPPIDFQGVRFLAKREVQKLNAVNRADVRFGGMTPTDFGTSGLPWTLGSCDDKALRLDATVSVWRCTRAKSTPPITPGTDVYALSNLRHGFALEGATLFYSPQKGVGDKTVISTYDYGAYAVTIDNDSTLHVDWGSYRIHPSPALSSMDDIPVVNFFMGAVAHAPLEDRNSSAYSLDITVIGPRGVSPFNP